MKDKIKSHEKKILPKLLFAQNVAWQSTITDIERIPRRTVAFARPLIHWLASVKAFSIAVACRLKCLASKPNDIP